MIVFFWCVMDYVLFLIDICDIEFIKNEKNI